MRRWIAEHIAPFESVKIFRPKGAIGVVPSRVSEDYACFHVDVTADFAVLRLPTAAVSVDYARPIVATSFTSYSPCFDEPALRTLSEIEFELPASFEHPLYEYPEVSENLLTPLTTCDVKGKSYPETQQPTDSRQKALFGLDAPENTGSRLRKAYRETNEDGRATREVLTIWDLILPLLKRPLDLDCSDSFGLLPNELFPFQIEGVRRLVSSRCFLLADEMGTGKTVMTCVALRILFHLGKVRRVLIACPKSVLGVWDAHLRDWADTLHVTVVNGHRNTRCVDWRCPAHVYVATYDTIRNDTTRAPHETRAIVESGMTEGGFDVVVLDEAHAIRNRESGRAKGIRRVARDARFRWALTGTPIQNSIDDLRSLFDFLKPSLFPRDGPISADEAKRKIEPYFRRKRKQDVFPELPAKIRSEEWLDLSESQRAEYDSVLAIGQHDFRSGTKEFTRLHVFKLLNELKRICNFASGEDESAKTELLLEQVEQIVQSEKKALVFSQYKGEGVDKLEPLVQRFGVVRMTGEMSDSARQSAIEAFQRDPSKRVFLGTVKTAGEGITLTAASYVIHFDHWWNPAVAWQAEDRAHRKGQTEMVNVYSYWMRGTVEERIRGILQRKGLLHAEIIDGLSESEFEEALSLDDLLEVLDLDRGSVRIPEAERQRVSEVHDRLSQLDPYGFERAIMRVFQQALGFTNARVTGRPSDGGIDVEATKVGRTGGVERVVAQCKRTPVVGPNFARELLGVLSANPALTKGYLATSGRLTRACRDFCQTQGRIEGIDGVQLARWIQEYSIELD